MRTVTRFRSHNSALMALAAMLCTLMAGVCLGSATTLHFAPQLRALLETPPLTIEALIHRDETNPMASN